MVEVWTEDDGAGFVVISNLIQSYYGRKWIRVKKHNGNGMDDPRAGDPTSNGGLLYDLVRNRNNSNMIIIFADLVFDNKDVMQYIDKIKLELASYHPSTHRLYGLYSFEYGMLTYKHLRAYGGMENSDVQKDINTFLRCFKNRNFNRSLIPDNASQYMLEQRKTKDRTGENISKALLNRATNGINIKLKKMDIQGAVIQKSKVGMCWRCDCCKYGASVRVRKCKGINTNIPMMKQKYIDLIQNSSFGKYIGNINNTMEAFVSAKYQGKHANNLESQSKYRVLNCGKSQAELLLIMTEYVQRHGFWNYIQIFNVIQQL